MPDDQPTDSVPLTDSDFTPLQAVPEAVAAYNIVSDTVTGVNVRWSDNKFQAVFIAISMLVLSVAGTVLGLLFGGKDMPWFVGTLIGAFAGMIFGVFASGIYLMLYRAFRHIGGKHD